MEKADVWRSGTERSYLSTSDWQVIYINALPNLTFSFPRSFFLSVLFLISGKTPKGIISPQLTPLDFFSDDADDNDDDRKQKLLSLMPSDSVTFDETCLTSRATP